MLKQPLLHGQHPARVQLVRGISRAQVKGERLPVQSEVVGYIDRAGAPDANAQSEGRSRPGH